MQARFTLAVLLGVVLLAAAACSSGGDDERIAELETDLEASEEALERETEARETAEREAAEAKKRADDAEDETADAKKRADDAEEETADAEEEIADAEEEIADAKEAQQTAEQGQRQAQQQQQQLQQQLTEAEQAELNARALKYLEAINGGGTDRTTVTVTYERGSTLKINPGGNFETGSGAPAISGFTPRTYTRETGVSGEQTLYLYTNIQAPGTRAFWKIYGLEETSIGISDAKARPNAAPRVKMDDANNPTTITETTVSGTYDGVSGTFTCTAADCQTNVQVVDGQRSFTGDTWDFKPGSINSGVQQMRDTEHLYFGIWTQEPNVASEEHMYQYIVGGSNEMQGSVQPQTLTYGDLTGTAKFAGGAVGKYVTRDQVGDNAVIGTFTASANLTADFDADTLEGRITNFRDGSRALTNWNVYLGGSATGPVENVASTATTGVVAASIGGVDATGAWAATLHGTDNPGQSELFTADPDKYPLSRYPLADLAGITGNFYATDNATTPADANAALAGAFGATPQ